MLKDISYMDIMLLLGEKDLIIYQQTKIIEMLNNKIQELLEKNNGNSKDSK